MRLQAKLETDLDLFKATWFNRYPASKADF